MFQSHLRPYTDASEANLTGLTNLKSPDVKRGETPRDAEADINFYPDPRVSGIF